jgi:hypothetical protein
MRTRDDNENGSDRSQQVSNEGGRLSAAETTGSNGVGQLGTGGLQHWLSFLSKEYPISLRGLHLAHTTLSCCGQAASLLSVFPSVAMEEEYPTTIRLRWKSVHFLLSRLPRLQTAAAPIFGPTQHMPHRGWTRRHITSAHASRGIFQPQSHYRDGASIYGYCAIY